MNKFEKNRYNLWKYLSDGGGTDLDYVSFVDKFFETESGANKLYNGRVEDLTDEMETNPEITIPKREDWIRNYACDKEWAKQICGSSSIPSSETPETQATPETQNVPISLNLGENPLNNRFNLYKALKNNPEGRKILEKGTLSEVWYDPRTWGSSEKPATPIMTWVEFNNKFFSTKESSDILQNKLIDMEIIDNPDINWWYKTFAGDTNWGKLQLGTQTATQQPQQQQQQGKTSYTRCDGVYKYGCYNAEAISIAQYYLGINVDGKFGPDTLKSLRSIGYETFTDNDIEDIRNKAAAAKSASKPISEQLKLLPLAPK